MKIIYKSFFVFLLFLIIIETVVIYGRTSITNLAVILLYSILIIWLYKTYSKTCIKNKYHINSIKEITFMIILSCAVFICFYISETGFISYFIPNYSSDTKLKAIEMINASILAPISEEILFRGIVLNQIMKKHSFLFANTIQAAIFAILHFDLRIFIFLFLAGIMLGIMCNYLNLYCSILIHSLKNLTNVILMTISIKFIELQKQEYLIMGIVFLIITAGLLIKIKAYKKYGIE